MRPSTEGDIAEADGAAAEDRWNSTSTVFGDRKPTRGPNSTSVFKKCMLLGGGARENDARIDILSGNVHDVA